MTYEDLNTNDILTLRVQMNGGEITADTFTNVLDAYEDALEVIEAGHDKQDEFEGEVKWLHRSGEKAGEEITQLENQVTMLQEALKEATKRTRRA